MTDKNLICYIIKKKNKKSIVIILLVIVLIAISIIFLTGLIGIVTVFTSIIFSYIWDEFKELKIEWNKAKERVGVREFNEKPINENEIFKKDINLLKKQNEELKKMIENIQNREPEVYKVEIKQIAD